MKYSVRALVLVLILVGTVCAQGLVATPSPLVLSAQAGTSSVQGTLAFSSSTSTPVTFTLGSNVTWIQVPAGTYTTPATVTVTVNPAGLPAGLNEGSLIAFVGGTPVPIAVRLSVSSISVSQQSVAFGNYLAGSTAYPAAQTVTVNGAAGSFSIERSTTDGAGWFTAAMIGTPASAILVAIDPSVARTLTPGSYTGNLKITPGSVSNPVSINVPVTLTVTAAPIVTVAPASLSFNWQSGGTNNQTQQTLSLGSNSSAALGYTALAAGTFLSIPPASAVGTIASSTQPAQIQVNVDGNGLPAATHNGSVTLNVPGAVFENQQSGVRTVQVTLRVYNLPVINVSTASLSFTSQFGGAAPAAVNVTPTSTGAPNTQVQFTVVATTAEGGSWLKVPAGVLTTGSAFAVSVEPSTLLPRTYTGAVTLTPVPNGSGQSAIQIPVSYTVTNSAALTLTPNSLVFPYQIGQPVPGSQTVRIASSTGAPLNYTVAVPSGAAWLLAGGALTGTTDGNLVIAVNPTGLAAGPQEANITVTATDPATGAAAGTLTLNVKLYVSATPLLTVSPSGPVVLTAQPGLQSNSVTIALGSTSSAQADQLNLSIQPNVTWLGTTALASTPGTLMVVAIAPSGMAPGTYPATITVTATGAGGAAVANSPYVIPVTLQLNAAAATVDPVSLTFTQVKEGSAPPAKSVTVRTNGASLPFSAVANDGGIGWLTVAQASGSTPGTFSVSAGAARLTPGTYQGRVFVTVPNGGGSPFTIPVTFTVTSGQLAASPTSLSFALLRGGTAPAKKSIAVTSSGAQLSYTVAASTDNSTGSWLTATPAGGTTPGTVEVGIAGTNLAPGNYTGAVTITPTGAGGTPVRVPVALTVTAAVTLAASPENVTFAYTIGGQAPAAQTVQLTGGAAPFTASATTAGGGSWLSVTPAGGTAPAALSISANTTGMAAGTYSGTVTVQSPAAINPLTIGVTLTITAVPTPVVASVGNAASYATVGVAPGENIVIFGTGIGPAAITSAAPTAGRFPTTLADTRILFDDIPAPIIYVSATQTSVMVPYSVGGRTTTNLVVEHQGVRSNPVPYNVVAAAPGLYTLNRTGTGPGAILNEDYAVNGAGAPAAKRSIIQVFMTGEGATIPASPDGRTAPLDGTGLFKPILPVTATVGGFSAPVLYYGSAPGLIYGVMQVNVELPAGLASGDHQVVILVGSNRSQNGVTVRVQ